MQHNKVQICKKTKTKNKKTGAQERNLPGSGENPQEKRVLPAGGDGSKGGEEMLVSL